MDFIISSLKNSIMKINTDVTKCSKLQAWFQFSKTWIDNGVKVLLKFLKLNCIPTETSNLKPRDASASKKYDVILSFLFSSVCLEVFLYWILIVIWWRIICLILSSATLSYMTKGERRMGDLLSFLFKISHRRLYMHLLMVCCWETDELTGHRKCCF